MTEYKLVIDCSTGAQEYIPLTAAELAQRDQDAALHAEQKAEREAEELRVANLKASAKAKLIAGEPLSADEASVLVI